VGRGLAWMVWLHLGIALCSKEVKVLGLLQGVVAGAGEAKTYDVTADHQHNNHKQIYKYIIYNDLYCIFLLLVVLLSID